MTIYKGAVFEVKEKECVCRAQTVTSSGIK